MKIGPVSARFKGNLQMTNIQAPHSYTINFDGQGGVAGFGKGSAPVGRSPRKARRRGSSTPPVPRSAARWRRSARA